MASFLHILAKSDAGRLVIFLIVIAFWLLSALVNWVKKQQEEAQRRRVREAMNAPPPPAAPVQPKSRQNLSAALPPWRAETQRRAPARVQPPPRLPPAVLQPAPQPRRAASRKASTSTRVTPQSASQRVGTDPAAPSSSRPGIADTEIRSAPANSTTPRSLSANASTLNRWLRPATLRQQFMLTEVLQPPVALREDRI